MIVKGRLHLLLERHAELKTMLKQPRRLVLRYRHLGIRDTDVLLASFPRSGNTWLRFMLGELLSGRRADFEHIDHMIPDVGEHRHALALLPGGGRLIKTHELYRPPGVRTLYLVRDVRAVLSSMYKMQKRGGYRKDIGAFVHDFVAGRAGWFGSWVDHVNFWLGPEPFTSPNCLLIRFEDLREDTLAVLREITGFLGIEMEEPRLVSVIENNDLSKMQEKERNAAEGTILNRRPDLPFVGSGSVAGWRQELDPEHVVVVERAAAGVLERLGYPMSLAR